MGVNGGVYDFPMLEVGDFLGINTDLRLDPNSIPYPVFSSDDLFPIADLKIFSLCNVI